MDQSRLSQRSRPCSERREGRQPRPPSAPARGGLPTLDSAGAFRSARRLSGLGADMLTGSPRMKKAKPRSHTLGRAAGWPHAGGCRPGQGRRAYLRLRSSGQGVILCLAAASATSPAAAWPPGQGGGPWPSERTAPRPSPRPREAKPWLPWPQHRAQPRCSNASNARLQDQQQVPFNERGWR